MKEKYPNDMIVEHIQQIVSEILHVDPNTLQLTDPVFGPGDGLVTSFYWVEVNIAVEDKFHLEIPDEDVWKLETIGDYVNYIRRWQEDLPPFEDISSPTQISTKKRIVQKKPTAEPHGQQQDSLSLAWEFHQGHWERTEDPIQQGEMKPDQDIKHILQQRGYKPSPILRMGKREQGMQVEVYAKEQKERNGVQNYYVRLHIGPEVETIYISSLPSLLSLLQRLGPIIANSQDLGPRVVLSHI